MSRQRGLCQDGGLWFLQAAWPGKQDLDILRHTRVCGAGDNSQQSIFYIIFSFLRHAHAGSRQGRGLLVSRNPHIRANDWHVSVTRKR